MNKFMKSFVILAVVVIAFGSATAVFAQSTPPENAVSGSGYGRGGVNRRSGSGTSGGMLGENGANLQDGLLHDEMIADYAEALGISVADLEARLADGETMAQIAFSTGMTVEDFRTLMLDIRALALDQAVLDGTLTQEQADWLKTRGAGMGNTTGRQGRAQRLNRTGDCPYGQVTP